MSPGLLENAGWKGNLFKGLRLLDRRRAVSADCRSGLAAFGFNLL